MHILNSTSAMNLLDLPREGTYDLRGVSIASEERNKEDRVKEAWGRKSETHHLQAVNNNLQLERNLGMLTESEFGEIGDGMRTRKFSLINQEVSYISSPILTEESINEFTLGNPVNTNTITNNNNKNKNKKAQKFSLEIL